MLTDLVFLQLPPQIAGESDGLSQLTPQPVENSEFSTFLPVIEHSLLPALVDVAGQLPAAPVSDPALIPFLSDGQLLPPGGDPLPEPVGGSSLVAVEVPLANIATPAHVTESPVTAPIVTAPAPMAPAPMAPAAMAPAPMAPATMAPATMAPATMAPATMAPAAMAPAPIAKLAAQPAPTPASAPVTVPVHVPAPATNASPAMARRASMPLIATPVGTSQVAQGAPPTGDLALERQLPAQLAVALTREMRPVQSIAVERPVEVYHESLEPGAEDLQLRPATNDRLTPPRLPSLPTLTLNVERPGWQPALGERLVWMVSHGQQRADIKLDPPQLGRVDVQIVMQGERAQLVFAAETPASRELLEQSLPRLREMMSDAGIDLASVDVADRERQSAQQDDRYPADGTDLSGQAPEWVGETDSSGAVSGNTALLDLFV